MQEPEKALASILKEIDDIIDKAMPGFVPRYTIIADSSQGFGIVPEDDVTACAVGANKDKLHPLYSKAVTLIKEYNLNFSARRKREPYALRSVETRTLDGKLISKKSFDNHEA